MVAGKWPTTSVCASKLYAFSLYLELFLGLSKCCLRYDDFWSMGILLDWVKTRKLDDWWDKETRWYPWPTAKQQWWRATARLTANRCHTIHLDRCVPMKQNTVHPAHMKQVGRIFLGLEFWSQGLETYLLLLCNTFSSEMWVLLTVHGPRCSS